MHRLALALLLAACPAMAQPPPATPPAPTAVPTPVTVTIAYVGLPEQRAAPSTALESLPADEGLMGARMALAEDAATGRFLGQSYAMPEMRSDAAGVLAAVKTFPGVIVANLPAPLLLQAADAAPGTLFLDIATADDALRGADCRRNVLHVAPSRAMLADALMQYLVTKDWHRILLLTGHGAGDALYADAMRRSAHKYRVTIAADKPWTFNAAAQQADTGHDQVAREVAEATRGPSYDVLVVADETAAFGDDLAYRTTDPRPVAGTQGMTPTAWTRLYDEFGAAQIQLRFRKRAGRAMTPRDYAGWLAVRAVGEAAVRGGKADAASLAGYLRGAEFQLAGYKGEPMSFRAWDGQLRQPVLLADERSLVTIAPLPGFLHETTTLDTLGIDRPESACKLP